MIMVGIGFIALGIVLFMVLNSAQAGTQDNTSNGAGEFTTTPIKVNYPAPELELTNLDGARSSLKDYLGSVILVNMWATWCPPCKAEMPTLQDFYEKHREEGFILIGINDGDTLDVVAPFAKEYGLTFPVWLDADHSAGQAFKAMSLPSSFVIDRAGTVRLSWVGAISAGVLEKNVTPIITE
jgi:peroxiredoxin